MVSSKQTTTKDISLISMALKLDQLALDSHPKDEKIGIKTSKRTIHLSYIDTGGVIYAPIHLWVFGWLKELFKSKAKGTVVHLPDMKDAYALGEAKNILVGKTLEEWNRTGEDNVPYALGEELREYGLWPYHEYVSTGGGRTGSIIKYFYKVNADTRKVPILITTLLPPKTVTENLTQLGKRYGIGPKASGYRIGTFDVLDVKVSKIGEVFL